MSNLKGEGTRISPPDSGVAWADITKGARVREKTYRIGEAADMLRLKSYVLRFWETEFPQLAPLRTDKGQRLYTDYHIALLHRIRHLLHEQGMTIEGARRVLASTARVDVPLEAEPIFATPAPVSTPMSGAVQLTAPVANAVPMANATPTSAADFQPPPTVAPTGGYAVVQAEHHGHYMAQEAGHYAPQSPSPALQNHPPVQQGNGASIDRTVVREMREELLALRVMLTAND